MATNQLQERIVRVLIFILLGFIVVRYCLRTSGSDQRIGSASDLDQIKIVLGMTVVFMFVNTYYPVVVTKNP
jgi:hypothetical protein